MPLKPLFDLFAIPVDWLAPMQERCHGNQCMEVNLLRLAGFDPCKHCIGKLLLLLHVILPGVASADGLGLSCQGLLCLMQIGPRLV